MVSNSPAPRRARAIISEREAQCKHKKNRPAEPDGAAILALPGHEALYGARHVLPLGEGDSAERVAAGLFTALRRLDDEQARVILSEAVDAEGVGLAVMNRLGRAAAFRIVKVK